MLKVRAKRYKDELANHSMSPLAWLLIFYSVITGLTAEIGFSVPLTFSTDIERSCFFPTPESVIDSTHLFIVQNSLFCVLYPFTGWFSDILVGRKKALSLSLWLCWLGTLLQCISYCIQYSTCGLAVNIAKYGISGVAFLLIIVGNAGLFTNIPAFGMDQLFEKPHTHSQAFIYWTVWGVFLGFLPAYIGFVPYSLHSSELIQITGVAIFLLSSVSVMLYTAVHHRFEPPVVITQSQNPYTLIVQVLKYAWYNKVPVNRSAFTFCEDKFPSRIDLGMTKYGGPFTIDEVEDVKVFLRIMLIFMCTFGIFIPYYHTLIGALFYIDQFHGATTSLAGYGSFVLWKSCDSLILLIVPLLMLVIIPLFPKAQYFMSNSLRGFVSCYVFTCISVILLIILECVHSLNSVHDEDISFLYFAFPLVFSGLIGSLSLVFGLQFIYSQAPQSMKGMLTGLYWFIRVFYSDIGALFTYLPFRQMHRISPSLWIFVLQFVVTVAGLACFLIAVKWYKARKRSDDYDLHWNIEHVYNEYALCDTSSVENAAPDDNPEKFAIIDVSNSEEG